MTGRAPGRVAAFRISFGRLDLMATDALILVTLALFIALALIFEKSVDGWGLLVAKSLGVFLVVLSSAAFARRIRVPLGRFLLRTATVTLSFAFLFEAVAPLQLILHGRFLDDVVLAFEQRLFGVQPTVWLERFIKPSLTEWLMFCYVLYLPLYPVLCAILWVRRGEAAVEEYFFILGLTNVLCDVGFILFPVAGPLYWIPGRYSVPLDGGAFTWAGEFIRQRAHFAGGSIPSPHAAVATVMWLMTWRHFRPAFWALSPMILSLYISTFYCRYHYLTDLVAGIATAALAALVAPLCLRVWDRLARVRGLSAQ